MSGRGIPKKERKKDKGKKSARCSKMGTEIIDDMGQQVYMKHVVVDLLCFMVMVSFMGGVAWEGKLQEEGEVHVHVHERELEGGR